MSHALRVVLLLAVLVGGFGVWWQFGRTRTPETATPASASRRGGPGGGPVLVATAGPAELPVVRNAIGTIIPLAQVVVRPQVAGILDRVLFAEGQAVQAGDPLAEIDAKPFALAQAQYEGQLRRDQAQLAQARQDLERYRTLVEQGSLSRQQVDTQATLVHQLEGAVATDTALIDTAKLNQSYCRITAPIAGRLGLRLVDAGNRVAPTDATGLVTIAQIRPIQVAFTVPEVDVPQVLAPHRAGVPLAVRVLGRDGTTVLGDGVVTALDNAIDPATGTLRLRAALPNDDERLFPNQYVQVRLILDTRQAAVAVPATAVLRGPAGSYVWSVSEGAAHQRPIRPGIQAGDQVEILEGLAAGDQVVVDGLDRIKEGAAVVATVAGPSAQPADRKAHDEKRRRQHGAPAGSEGRKPNPPAGD